MGNRFNKKVKKYLVHSQYERIVYRGAVHPEKYMWEDFQIFLQVGKIDLGVVCDFISE